MLSRLQFAELYRSSYKSGTELKNGVYAHSFVCSTNIYLEFAVFQVHCWMVGIKTRHCFWLLAYMKLAIWWRRKVNIAGRYETWGQSFQRGFYEEMTFELRSEGWQACRGQELLRKIGMCFQYYTNKIMQYFNFWFNRIVEMLFMSEEYYMWNLKIHWKWNLKAVNI